MEVFRHAPILQKIISFLEFRKVLDLRLLSRQMYANISHQNDWWCENVGMPALEYLINIHHAMLEWHTNEMMDADQHEEEKTNALSLVKRCRNGYEERTRVIHSLLQSKYNRKKQRAHKKVLQTMKRLETLE